MEQKQKELLFFLRFCKDKDILNNLISQTTKQKLLNGLDSDYRSRLNNRKVIHCPLYSFQSVGHNGFSSTKEGFNFWWDLYYDFEVWIEENNYKEILFS